jgi:hypothetical protein
MKTKSINDSFVKQKVAMQFICMTGAISKLLQGPKNPEGVNDCFSATRGFSR